MANYNTTSMGNFAGTLATQIMPQVASTITDRLFRKKDRQVNWEESQRYGERNQQWAMEMAQYNQALSKEMAQYNQGLSKEFYDYTSKYESPAEQMKRLKEAGLNPALMYEGGAQAGGGATGGAQAQTPQADSPKEEYKPMGMPSVNFMMRETPAERELKLAQAENLRSEVEERRGVGKELKEAQTQSIITGIESDKAKQALTRAQTLGEELNNKLRNAQYDDMIDITRWTGKRMAQEFSIAESEAYINRETRQEKIDLLKQTLTNSIIDAELKKSQIGQILKQGNKTDAEIEKIASDISQGLVKLEQGERGLDIEQGKLEIQNYLKQYVGIDKLGGRILNDAIGGMIKTVNAGLNALGLNTNASW